MSWYYKQEFTSPKVVYGRVQEEFRTYFEAGMVDDLLFPLWTDDCIRRFRKSAYKIQEAVLFIDNYEAKLPPDFHKIREAWACTTTFSDAIRTQGNFYYAVTSVVDSTVDRCQELICEVKCQNSCNPCLDSFETVYKTTEYQQASMTRSYLLKPGNISAAKCCETGCPNLVAEAPNTFDIRDGKMATTFPQGEVHLVYYANEFDDNNNQLIPDNHFFARYLEAYLKSKLMTQLQNQATDESFNQIRVKKADYERELSAAFVMAEQEFRSQTIEQKIMSISKNRNRLRKYRIR